MSFLGNRAVTALSVHLACKRLAQSFGDLFGPLFLYSLGIPLPTIFFVWAAQYVLRLLVRPFALQLQVRLGLKKSVILGTIVFAGLWPVLSLVDGLGWPLVLFICYSALADCLYWLPFHAYYAALGDIEHRGKQIGVREGLVSIMSATGPALGGLIVTYFGFSAGFYAASLITLLATGFLFLIPDISPGTPLTFREAWRTVSLRGLCILATDSLGYHTNVFIWSIVVFLMLQSYVTVGWLAGLTVFFTAVSFLVFGHLIDGGHGRRIGVIGCCIIGLAALLRSLFGFSIPTIIAADLVFALSAPFYVSIMNTMAYNSSKRSPNTHWFHFFAEAGWDLGAITALVMLGFATLADVPLRNMMLVSLISVGLMLTIVLNYFKKPAHA